MDLPNTAMLLYSILLDRATFSQKNAYTDENDWVYVIYPIENLLQTFRKRAEPDLLIHSCGQ